MRGRGALIEDCYIPSAVDGSWACAYRNKFLHKVLSDDFALWCDWRLPVIRAPFLHSSYTSEWASSHWHNAHNSCSSPRQQRASLSVSPRTVFLKRQRDLEGTTSGFDSSFIIPTCHLRSCADANVAAETLALQKLRLAD